MTVAAKEALEQLANLLLDVAESKKKDESEFFFKCELNRLKQEEVINNDVVGICNDLLFSLENLI